MNQKTLLTVILCMMVAMPMCVTAISDESDAYSTSVNGVEIHSFDDAITIDAGNIYTLTFTLYNNNPETNYISISDAVITDEDLGTLTYTKDIAPLDNGKTATIEFIIDIDKYADSGEHDLKFTITACNSNDTSIKESKECIIPITIKSLYASGEIYNKFIGLIPNELPSPFNNSLFTAIVSLIAFFIVSALIGHLIYKGVEKKWSKDDSMTKKDAKSIGVQSMFILIIIGFSICLRIYGASEVLTGMVTDIISVVFIIIVAYIAWRIFKIVLFNVMVKLDKDDKIDDTLMPLFKMIGRIVICVIAVSSILSIFGMSLGVIVTSAGLVSLAISLGAQETLNQFFCGIQLMATRPFRIGDKVRLGTDTDVLIVRKIRVMDTEFKNWLNEEVFRIPNSTVMSSMITNITYEDDTYKIYEYIDVDYGADIEKAKEIMLDVVSSHPQVITDGSKSEPSFRFSSMEASAIRLRVSYVLTDHELSYTVPCQIRELIYKRFRAEGIKVPHNIVDVHVEE